MYIHLQPVLVVESSPIAYRDVLVGHVLLYNFDAALVDAAQHHVC